MIEYKPLLDEALRRAEHQPDTTVIFQRPQATAELGPKDVEWSTLITPNAVPPAGCVTVEATDSVHPLHLRYHRAS